MNSIVDKSLLCINNYFYYNTQMNVKLQIVIFVLEQVWRYGVENVTTDICIRFFFITSTSYLRYIFYCKLDEKSMGIIAYPHINIHIVLK